MILLFTGQIFLQSWKPLEVFSFVSSEHQIYYKVPMHLLVWKYCVKGQWETKETKTTLTIPITTLTVLPSP